MLNPKTTDQLESRAALLMILGSALSIILIIWRSGFTMTEMDWDCDGHTSLHEISEAVDVRRRPVEMSGIQCYEYFDMRTGSMIRTDCPSRPCVELDSTELSEFARIGFQAPRRPHGS